MSTIVIELTGQEIADAISQYAVRRIATGAYESTVSLQCDPSPGRADNFRAIVRFVPRKETP